MEKLNLSALLTNQNSMSPVSDADYERVLNNRERVEPRVGIECAKCGNHEYTWVVRDGEKLTRDCECRTVRNNINRIANSGLAEQMERCTFENFRADESWQQNAKAIVTQFVRTKERGWLVLCGQPGCGKTHLCTAATGKFLRAGADARYMRWVDESILLKALVNDEVGYGNRINKLKSCKVLYIDDFWKTQRGKEPSPADVKLAFDLLDHRYCNRGLITIISTERDINDILDIDPAVGSRIYEMSRGYCVDFGQGGNRNWRLHDAQ